MNKTVGFTQVYLMFGRHSRLQLDAMFQINEQTTRSNLSYSIAVKEWEQSRTQQPNLPSKTQISDSHTIKRIMIETRCMVAIYKLMGKYCYKISKRKNIWVR